MSLNGKPVTHFSCPDGPFSAVHQRDGKTHESPDRKTCACKIPPTQHDARCGPRPPSSSKRLTCSFTSTYYLASGEHGTLSKSFHPNSNFSARGPLGG